MQLMHQGTAAFICPIEFLRNYQEEHNSIAPISWAISISLAFILEVITAVLWPISNLDNWIFPVLIPLELIILQKRFVTFTPSLCTMSMLPTLSRVPWLQGHYLGWGWNVLDIGTSLEKSLQEFYHNLFRHRENFRIYQSPFSQYFKLK